MKVLYYLQPKKRKEENKIDRERVFFFSFFSSKYLIFQVSSKYTILKQLLDMYKQFVDIET